MEWLATLPIDPLLILAVIVASWLFPLPEAYHPLTLFRFFAKQLAKKVNPDLSRSTQQQLISGSLAVFVAILPIWLLFYALYQFSELPWLLDALILYGCLDWRRQTKAATKVGSLLQGQQLSLAKQQAATILLRDTKPLNEMGVSKAVIESLVLHSSKLFLACLGYFMLGGGLAVLAYRLLQELQRQWNPKCQHYINFGQPASAIANLTSAPASLFSACLLALQYGLVNSYKKCQQHRQFFNRGSFYLLCCASEALQCDLGGPAYYGNIKLARMRFNAKHPPIAADIAKAMRQLHFLHFYFFLLVCAVGLLNYLWLY